MSRDRQPCLEPDNVIYNKNYLGVGKFKLYICISRSSWTMIHPLLENETKKECQKIIMQYANSRRRGRPCAQVYFSSTFVVYQTLNLFIYINKSIFASKSFSVTDWTMKKQVFHHKQKAIYYMVQNIDRRNFDGYWLFNIWWKIFGEWLLLFNHAPVNIVMLFKKYWWGEFWLSNWKPLKTSKFPAIKCHGTACASQYSHITC